MEVTLNTKANQVDVDASLSLKANQTDVDLAFSLTDGQIDAVNVSFGTKANQVDMENNATLISVLDTDLTANAHRIYTLETNNVETLSSNIETLHGNVEKLSGNVNILHGNVETLSSKIEILHGNVESLNSNIEILHGIVETIESNISILHGNVVTLTVDLGSNAARTSVLESNIYYSYEGVDEVDVPIVLLGNVTTLHTFVEGLETNLTDNSSRIDGNTERIAAIEADYVTNADLVTAVVPTAVGASILTAASTWYTSASGVTKSVGDFFNQLTDVEDDSPDFAMTNFVQKPTDWVAYGDLKAYAEEAFKHKAEAKKAWNKALAQVWKIIINSAYGF